MKISAAILVAGAMALGHPAQADTVLSITNPTSGVVRLFLYADSKIHLNRSLSQSKVLVVNLDPSATYTWRVGTSDEPTAYLALDGKDPRATAGAVIREKPKNGFMPSPIGSKYELAGPWRSFENGFQPAVVDSTANLILVGPQTDTTFVLKRNP